MRDDELLAIYGATRQLAEGMAARDAELKQSTAALEATIAQVKQLPAALGQQSAQYIVAGIKQAVTENFNWPIRESVRGPLEELNTAAYDARTSLRDIKYATRFFTFSYLTLVLVLGFALGAFGTYFFFTRQVSALNDRFDQLQQQVIAPVPASTDAQAPASQTRKKHGQH